MNILNELARSAAERVEVSKKSVSLYEIRRLAENTVSDGLAFERAIKKPGLSFICECKRASPSKGLIAPDFPYLQIAAEYQAAGADAISVLTEPSRFLGNPEYLREISAACKIPCLRKDFTVDEYMIYEAKSLGAAAVLLICSILDEQRLSEYIKLCGELKLSALVEAHDEREIETALKAGAHIIGVNNRNLKDFSVDTKNSLQLRRLVPKDVAFVSESGIGTRADAEAAEKAGADAVLVGEALMRAENKREALAVLRGKQHE